MEVEFTPTSEEDILELIARLNPADERELLALGVQPGWGIRKSVSEAHQIMTARIAGELACVVGITLDEGLADSTPMPWLFGTEVLFRNQRALAIYTRKVIEVWLTDFPVVSNYVDIRHEKAISWLKHFGAEFDFPAPYGPLNRLFMKFTFRRTSCASLR